MRFQKVKIPIKFCEHCGSQLYPKLGPNGSQESMNQFSERKFCDRRCKGLKQRLPNGPKLGGLPHRGRKIARRIVTKRYCEKCGATERLEVHHKDGDATNNKAQNLAVLCMKCHRAEHKTIGCKIHGCDRPHVAMGYCSKHYQRLKSYGDAMVKHDTHGRLIKYPD